MSPSPEGSEPGEPSPSDPASWREQQLFREGPVTVFRWVATSGWPVEYVSPNVRQFGYTAEDFTSGRVPYAKVVHPDDLGRITSEITTHSALGATTFEQDYRIVRPDGEERVVFDRTVIVRDAGGRITHYDGYVIDVTERRRSQEERRALELQRQQSQKLESLGLLAGGVAHDFNNLLHAVLANASLALAQLRADDPVRSAVAAIELAARRASELANEMLAYSGRGRFQVEPIDLSRLVAEMVHLLRSSVSKKARMQVDLASDLPPVDGDATQLRQIVLNLVTNASDALGDAVGTIHVRTRLDAPPPSGAEPPLPREPLPAGPCVVLEVEDDGCGMDRATRARIFEPFFTTKQVGRGLGLAATLGIVRGHEGAILVKSELSRGTTVHLRFPVGKPAGDANAAAPPAPSPAASPTVPAASAREHGLILVVDDEPQVRDVVRKMLERLGERVRVAGDAAGALQAFRESRDPIVAAVVDLTLPDESGDVVVEKLRALRPDLPVVLSSGYDEHDSKPAVDTSSGFTFLRKPYTLAELDAALKRVLPPKRT